MKTNKKAFTLIEILVGAVIFMIGFAAVYNLLISTMNLNSYNKNYIIATSLAREQLELFRNIRDTNFSKMQNYDIINPQRCDENNECGEQFKFQKDKFYRISNDFSNSGGFPVKVEEKMEVDEDNLFETLKDYQVCFDLENNFYDYCDYITGNKKELNIYKYIKIDEIGIEPGENKDNLHKVEIRDENGIENFEKIQYDQNYALKVTSKVYWYNKKFQNFEAETIFTNYKIY